MPTSTPKLSKKHDKNNSFTPLNHYLEQHADINDNNNKSGDTLNSSTDSTRKKKRISLGSISRVFSRNKTRRSLAMPSEDNNGMYNVLSSEFEIMI